jgi:hypothetical protein
MIRQIRSDKPGTAGNQYVATLPLAWRPGGAEPGEVVHRCEPTLSAQAEEQFRRAIGAFEAKMIVALIDVKAFLVWQIGVKILG